jgi:hypothetical protein
MAIVPNDVDASDDWLLFILFTVHIHFSLMKNTCLANSNDNDGSQKRAQIGLKVFLWLVYNTKYNMDEVE